MTIHKERNAMRKTSFAFTIIVLISILALAVSGCFITRPIVSKVKSKKAVLKKRVMVLPIFEQTGSLADIVEKANVQFISLLSNSSDLLIVDPMEHLKAAPGEMTPEYGIVTPPELVEKAREKGIHALITTLLYPVETSTEKKGVWPFRRTVRIYEVSMIVNVMDVTTGVLYMTRLESEKLPFKLVKDPDQNEKTFINEAFSEAVPILVERQADVITDMLEEAVWMGNVLEVKEKTLKIDAGKDIGAEQGLIFTVFARSDSIKRKAGAPIDLRGRAVGEIRITEVHDEYSLAVPENEGGFLAGQIIRVKD